MPATATLDRPAVAAAPPIAPILPAASVIVVGYKSRGDLDRCFAALLAQDYPGAVEPLFVDNESGDGSADHVRAAFPAVSVVETGANLGYAAGNNLGAERASGEILVFLNPDTEVEPGWLLALVAPLATDPGIGLTTSKIVLMDDPGTINACGNQISLGGLTWCRGAGHPAATYTEDADVTAVSGAAFAIRADLFRRLGGFDPSFFMYLEDTDLSWGARQAGYRCRFVAGSVVRHRYRFSSSGRKLYYVERNRYRLLGKRLSRRGLAAVLPALVGAELLTWGNAAIGGREAVGAKLRATKDAPRVLAALGRRDSAADAALRDHRPVPAIADVVGGRLGRVAHAVFGLWFWLAGIFATAVLGPAPTRGRRGER